MHAAIRVAHPQLLEPKHHTPPESVDPEGIARTALEPGGPGHYSGTNEDVK
jgi:hypothetical protein